MKCSNLSICQFMMQDNFLILSSTFQHGSTFWHDNKLFGLYDHNKKIL